MSPLRRQKHFNMTFPTPWIHLTQTPSVGVRARREANQAQEEGLWGDRVLLTDISLIAPPPKERTKERKGQQTKKCRAQQTNML